MMTLGCAYFGVRIVRHVARDMDDLASLGYTGVLHTVSENDLTHYRGTLARMIEVSHAAGLEVQASPWGLGGTFGGEADSRFVAVRPDACQVLDDGTRVAAACLNHADYRAFCREWADAAVEAGVDRVFWDEPHWVDAAHAGADPARWGCRCDTCRKLFALRLGEAMPESLTDAVRAFREESLVDFLGEMVAHVEGRGGRSAVCLLPLVDGALGVRDWDAVAALPGLDTLATDPYWKSFGEPAAPFVARFARLVSETAGRHGVRAQVWLPSFGLMASDLPDFEAAVASARGLGIDDLWTWGYEACAHMSSLATPDAEIVWQGVTDALTRAQAGADGRAEPVTEGRVAAHADLDLRPTGELIELINDEDAKVPAAVRRASRSLAAAIDAIVERLEGGGRLVYVGAGSSGRLALVDAAECGPTFGVPPEQVLALVAGGPTALAVAQEAAEDDSAAGAEEVSAAGVGARDAVVALSAGGGTPYVVGAVKAAKEAGALTVGVVCAEGSALGRAVEHEIVAVVGPEVIAGSTRMKAGTAQKLVLNTISTISMVRLGKTFGNLMVDVVASNAKLRARARRTVALATGTSDDQVDAALEAAGGDVKVAIVSLLSGIDARSARARLDEAGGVVRRTLGAR
ncbi:MAG: N-acetylmuramic acid 6-phosphate etherase [Gaiellaceae bacterium]